MGKTATSGSAERDFQPSAESKFLSLVIADPVSLIPYLQHLAAFLENPKPQFSLEWTPESEKKIDEFLRRMDDPSAMQEFASGLGEWLNPDGSPTRLGRRMLPLIGVTPTKNGAALGYFGAEVIGTGDWYLDVGYVEPGSPAARAGLLTGDIINLVDRFQLWHPVEFARYIRRAGAGGAGKTFKRATQIKPFLEYGSTLYTLGQATLRMRTLGPQTEKESQELRDSLLPLQRKLSDQLDAEMGDPLVQRWMQNRAKVDC